MKRIALALIAMLSATPAVAEERKPVDVALVLALDVSGSVTEDNWRTQRDGVAGAVGIFFGWYPARRASQLDPIVALRRE